MIDLSLDGKISLWCNHYQFMKFFPTTVDVFLSRNRLISLSINANFAFAKCKVMPL